MEDGYMYRHVKAAEIKTRLPELTMSGWQLANLEIDAVLDMDDAELLVIKRQIPPFPDEMVIV